MIGLAKLSRLPEETKIRKCARLMEGAVRALSNQEEVDCRYLQEVARLVARSDEKRVGKRARVLCERLSVEAPMLDDASLMWACADAVFYLYADIGIEQADWDFTDRRGFLDSNHRAICPITVVLDRLRSPFNVGSVFRTSDSFGVEKILLVEATASPLHRRALRSSGGCVSTVRWHVAPEEEVLENLKETPVFALELKGMPIDCFSFPPSGAVIIGSEELGVSPRLLALAESSLGRVSIPLAGSKGSLNVSVAFGILMYAWQTRLAADKKEADAWDF